MRFPDDNKADYKIDLLQLMSNERDGFKHLIKVYVNQK